MFGGWRKSARMVKDDHDGGSGDGNDKEDEEAGEDEGQVEEENDREQAGVDKLRCTSKRTSTRRGRPTRTGEVTWNSKQGTTSKSLMPRNPKKTATTMPMTRDAHANASFHVPRGVEIRSQASAQVVSPNALYSCRSSAHDA